MKKLIILLFWLPLVFFSQEEFSFELYFEDALGNKDTLVLGYDPLATDSIDVAFGEVNIVNQPWDSVFEARALNLTWNSNGLVFDSIINSSKKQISKHSSDIIIGVKTSNISDVTMTWNNQDFNYQSLHNYSYFSFPNDVVTPPNFIFLNDNQEYTMCANGFCDLAELNIDSETIHYFMLNFSDTNVLSSRELFFNKNQIIFPNPINKCANNGEISIIGLKVNEIVKAIIYDEMGKVILNIDANGLENGKLDVSTLSSGLYFIQLINGSNSEVIKLIVN